MGTFKNYLQEFDTQATIGTQPPATSPPISQQSPNPGQAQADNASQNAQQQQTMQRNNQINQQMMVKQQQLSRFQEAAAKAAQDVMRLTREIETLRAQLK